MNERIQKELQSRIEDFGTDVTRILQRAVAEAMADAIKKLPAGKNGLGRGGRRSFPAVSADAVLKEITREGGRRVEEIAATMNLPSKAVGPVVKKLIADKKLKSTGKARGTKYRAA